MIDYKNDDKSKVMNLPALSCKGGNLSVKRKNGENGLKSFNLEEVRATGEIAKILKKDSLKQEMKNYQQAHSGLDLVLAGDLTGSMSSYHAILKNKFTEIASTLFSLIPNLRISIIFYLDHGSGDPYITKVIPLTTNVEDLTSFIQSTPDGSGGDADEAVEDALQELSNLNWNSYNKKSLVLFGDAGPHEANECPSGYDYFEIVRKLYEKGLVINSVYCNRSCSSEEVAEAYEICPGNFSRRVSKLDYCRFFSWIANVTGGVAISVKQIDDIVDIIQGLAAKDAGKFDELEKEIHKISSRPIPALEHIRKRAKAIEEKKKVLSIGYTG